MLNIAQMGVLGFTQDSLHPRLVAWLARGTALGYTLPSAAQQVKLNTFFNALESAGIITGVTSSLLDWLYIFAIDGNSDMATLNVIDPTLFQATKVNSPTFTSNQGFNGNASTSYLNTNWRPNQGVNFTLNNASIGCYNPLSIAVAPNKVSMGSFDAIGANGSAITTRFTGDLLACRINSGPGFFSTSNSNTIGFYQIQRTGASATKMFKNGAQVYSGTDAATGRNAFNMTLLASNVAGVINNFADMGISMAWAGASLAGLELSLYTAWNNYFTSL